MAELDEVKDGEESEDREEVTAGTEIGAGYGRARAAPQEGLAAGAKGWPPGQQAGSHVHSSLLSTSTSASESLSSSGVTVGACVSVAPGVSTANFRFRGWTQVVRGSGARETMVAHGGLLTTFCWAGGARATLGATLVSKLL